MLDNTDIKKPAQIPSSMNYVLLTIVILMAACSSQSPPKPQDTVEAAKITTQEPVTEQQPQIDRQKYLDGINALEQNQLDLAQLIFTEFNQANPNLSGALVNLALIHYMKGEAEESLQLLNRAIEINPRQAQAFHLRAQLRIDNREINEAEKDYLQAIGLKPDYINAHYNLALLYDIYFQDVPRALKHYQRYRSLIDYPDEATDDWIIHLKGTLENG